MAKLINGINDVPSNRIVCVVCHDIFIARARLHVRDTVFEGNQAGYDTKKAVDGSEFYGGGAAWMSSASKTSFAGCSFIRNGGGVSFVFE